MAKPGLVWILLYFHFLQCLSQGEIDGPAPDFQIQQNSTKEVDPSVGEYFQEAVDLLNRTRWRYFLPEDTDLDQDGQLSDLEIQQKFNTYVGELFKLIDRDEDNAIVEEELRNFKLDIPYLTKAVDIALENFPLKPFFLAADGNGDGFYDENDFYLPENIEERDSYSYLPSVTYYSIDKLTNVVTNGNNRIARIGQKEGTVICKSLEYNELERVVENDEISNIVSQRREAISSSMELLMREAYFVNTYSCEGDEARIEDCKRAAPSVYSYPFPDDRMNETSERGMGVICKGKKLGLGALHLRGHINNSSGDIFLGNKALMCHPLGYEEANSEVICRELGYPGLVRTTKDSSFTKIWIESNHKIRISKYFKCNGNERKLADCPLDSSGECQGEGHILPGVICKTDENPGIDRGLSQLIEWNQNSRIWEDFGRFLFIADTNGDGKLTLKELATKLKLLMTKILAFLDQNQDGKISLEDMNLNLSQGPINTLIQQLFDDDIKIAGRDLGKWTDNWSELRRLDDRTSSYDMGNGDGKLTADDVLLLRADNSLLVAMLSEKLDKNQDGKIQREELVQFTADTFNYLDMDHNDAVTLDDVYTLLYENGFHCFQVGALRSFIKRFIGTIDNGIKHFLGYVFRQFEIDGNGKISSEELEKMHFPCDMSIRIRYYYDDRGHDPNARKGCEYMFETFLGWKMRELIRAFPDLELDSGSHGGYRRFGNDHYRKDTVVNKMANAACGLIS